MSETIPEVRGTVWSMLASVAAGVVAGALVGGVGGRLAMLVLRLTSSEELHGMKTDDGFEIGVVTFDTVGLIAILAAAGAVNGALYAVLRRGIPARWRLPIWTVFGAATGGATIIHDDGLDFTVIEPLVLAVVMFVALPGVASAVVVLLAERWNRLEPFASRRRTAALVVAALAGTIGLVVAIPISVCLLVVDALRVRGAVARAATVVVTGGLAVVSIAAAVDVIRTSAAIL